MIKINTPLHEYTLTPTMFPDGTSQVWKLPKEIVSCLDLMVTWNFESEREILDLLSLRKLLPAPMYSMRLHVPFMPYGRQDKQVANDATFNLKVICDLINSLEVDVVSSVDVHNPDRTSLLLHHFKNVSVENIHKNLVNQIKPDFIVFPDLGAKNRYYGAAFGSLPRVIFYKERNQLTGEITGHTMSYRDASGMTLQGADMSKIAKPGDTFLIVDDICDGGATFISIAKKLKEQAPNIKIALFITHGIFSRGRDHLFNNGIDSVYTTNSLTKNGDGYQV